MDVRSERLSMMGVKFRGGEIVGAMDRVLSPLRPGWILATVCCAQLLILLDGTIMVIALPSIGQGVGMGPDTLPWVVTAYALTFGSLLLLGGRIADYRGRRRAFLVGMVGFVAASALGGAAQDGGVLIAARAAQGAFAALVVPAILSLISVVFVEPAARARAFTVYGAVSGMGIAMGMILGGVLTEYTSWRWCLLINVPVGALLLVSALLVLPESRLASRQGGYDVPGAVLATTGIGTLVYGFSHAATDTWTDRETVVSLIGSVALLGAFAVCESRAVNPLLPVRLIADPRRLGSLLGIMVAFMAIPPWTIFLVYFFQGVKGYSALESGLALLPYALACMLVAAATEKRLNQMHPRVPVAGGLLLAGLGMAWFTLLDEDWDYPTYVLPGVAVVGAGIIVTYIASASATQNGIAEEDTGVLSALFSASHQIGLAIGAALLTTIATTITERSADDRPPEIPDLVDGYSAGILGATALLLAGALVSWAVMRPSSLRTTAGRPPAGSETAAHHPDRIP